MSVRWTSQIIDSVATHAPSTFSHSPEIRTSFLFLRFDLQANFLSLCYRLFLGFRLYHVRFTANLDELNLVRRRTSVAFAALATVRPRQVLPAWPGARPLHLSHVTQYIFLSHGRCVGNVLQDGSQRGVYITQPYKYIDKIRTCSKH